MIDLRGEKFAVTQTAWHKLCGVNELGEVVNKKLATRKIILEEQLSRLQQHRPEVFSIFEEKISYRVVRIV